MSIFYHEKRREFHLQTKNTSYILSIHPSGHLIQVYYGKRVEDRDDFSTLYQSYSVETGSTILYHEGNPYTMAHERYEYPFYGKGDYREPAFELEFENGSTYCDYHFDSYSIAMGREAIPGLPTSYGSEGTHSLIIKLKDQVRPMQITLTYGVFEESDVITRSVGITNLSEEKVIIRKAMSINWDSLDANFESISLDGTWIRERHIHSRSLSMGVHYWDSKRGVSSSDHNPFLCLKKPQTTEQSGECYGFTLVYSGNHRCITEVNPYELLRVQIGINPFDFSYELEPQATFYTPEGVMTYSHEGMNGMSQHLHHFIQHHIVRGKFQFAPRPILANNWETTSFNFHEGKIVSLARSAKKLGMELFVLDDGWFGKRDTDTTSLGDWYVNKKKLPSGIDGLSHKIHKMGLDFGLWVEPEMISYDSDLYRAHPDWAVQYPNYFASLGRHQALIDLCNPEVVNYLFDILSKLFHSASLQYVKWDMNRNFSDAYSPCIKNQQEFVYRYYLGLYDLLDRLNKEFPDILFESCASGGNRFDLGMLCYMPQVWTSDDTDGYERQLIQYGTSMVYPPSTMGAHVSGNVNLQMMRKTPLETRFNVAAFGLLGYELDLTGLNHLERNIIRHQIEYYKEHRQLFQYGTFHRLESPFDSNVCRWMSVSSNKEEALYGYYQRLMRPTPKMERFSVSGLDIKNKYEISVRTQFSNIKTFGMLINYISPIKMKEDHLIHNTLDKFYPFKHEKESLSIPGEELCHFGFAPKHPFTSSGYSDSVRIVPDFGSRIYHLKKGE